MTVQPKATLLLESVLHVFQSRKFNHSIILHTADFGLPRMNLLIYVIAEFYIDGKLLNPSK